MSCWVCGQNAAVSVLEVLDADRGAEHYRVVSCSACRSGRLADFPSCQTLSAYYDNAYYGRGDSKFAAPLQAIVNFESRRLAGRIMRAVSAIPNPRVLDIGCGRGILLSELAQLGARGIGLERDSKVIAKRFASLEIRIGELAEQAFPDASLDVVVLWHVLEHLENPRSVLTEIYRILRPGGLLLLSVPNNGGWQARIFGARWFHVDAPRHLYCFGHEGLKVLLQREGFRVYRASTSDLTQNLFGFIQSSLNMVPGAPPNRLYQLMRSVQSPLRLLELLLWSVPAGVLLLPALLEYGWSAARGRGACSVLFSIRAWPQKPDPDIER